MVSAGKKATPIKVPIVAPMVAMRNSKGEWRNTATFIRDDAAKSLTAHTWPIDSAIPSPTLFHSISENENLIYIFIVWRW